MPRRVTRFKEIDSINSERICIIKAIMQNALWSLREGRLLGVPLPGLNGAQGLPKIKRKR